MACACKYVGLLVLEEHALLTEQVRPILLTGLWGEGQDSGWWWVQWMEGYMYSGGYTEFVVLNN